MPRKDGLQSEFREKLVNQHGPQFWRSLDELSNTEEFRTYLEQEFPHAASPENGSRRTFLKLMGASLVLAGLQGCNTRPEEKIIPYNRQPENIIPGIPLYYASALSQGGYGQGILVESHMGRPTKIEGNPEHPASLGATNIFSQASILTMYDPDRSHTIRNVDAISTWDAFLTNLKPILDIQKATQGKGLRFLVEPSSSPTLKAQFQQIKNAFPEVVFHDWSPDHRDQVLAGTDLAFGQDVEPVYDFKKADVVLSIDADFLGSGPGQLRYARDFMSKHNVANEDRNQSEMNRLYMVESGYSVTGAKADHRLAINPDQILLFLIQVANELGLKVPQAKDSGVPKEWVHALVGDLKSYRLMREAGKSLIIVGDHQPAEVHALAHAINDHLDNIGTTVKFIDPVLNRLPSQSAEQDTLSQSESLKSLIAAIDKQEVETLFILGGDPVFTAPSDYKFIEALDKVPYRVHLSLYHNETSAHCHWHLPALHELESWSDIRAYDGTASIIQPLIAPLYNGISIHQLLEALLDKPVTNPYDIVKATWQSIYQGTQPFEDWFQTAIHDGLIPDSGYEPVDVSLIENFFNSFREPESESSGIYLLFKPDPTIADGRYVNNGWLQELPKPMTQLTWDNVVLISPKDAKELKVNNGDLLSLTTASGTQEVPAWILPGHADRCFTLNFGYGSNRTGRVGTGTGVNVYPLRHSKNLWLDSKVEINKASGTKTLATTQHHHSMEGRHLIRSGTLDEYQAHPEHPEFVHVEHGHAGEISLFPEVAYEGYKWGMSINLGSCMGCNACVIACQAENNIPVVGKDQVAIGREMHWIRVDRYFYSDKKEFEKTPDVHTPQAEFQPVACVHCELAPCEIVCPVAATTHSPEGINEMTYNRCVGTRYCANNCPYKVRRFNFYNYTAHITETESLQLLQNPDVTVRTRGVMEKCNYCVQRVNQARITSKKEDREIQDGEVKTACQQVCPTQAIVFGDLNDEQSQVKSLHDNPLTYALLGELNTRPRTTYLAAVKNPNPKLVETKTNSHTVGKEHHESTH